MNHRPRFDRTLLALLIAALALRCLGLTFGFPCLVNSDESHHVNLAVSFGSGHLNPHIFKYPTLWMYLLFGLYGIFFLLWSGLGLLHSTADFAGLFVWHPERFYFLARLASAASGAWTVLIIYLTAKKMFNSRRAALFSAALAAFSPPLIFYAHFAKPDIFMLMLVATGYYFLVRHAKNGPPMDFYIGCALLGLACSTQYTAALAVPFLIFPGLQNNGGHKKIAVGFFLVIFFFFLGSPFILLDWKTFLADLNSLRAYGAGNLTSNAQWTGLDVLAHYAQVPNLKLQGWIPYIVPAILMALLVFAAGWGMSSKTSWILWPLLVGGVFLASQNKQAGVINYAFPLFPFIFLLMGSLETAFNKAPKMLSRLAKVSAVLFFPLFFGHAIIITTNFMARDTRVEATRWSEANIPSGSKLLIDQEYTEPHLFPTRGQTERLLEKTKSLNNPRARYYEAMLRTHPGGGYELIHLERTAKELISPLERQTESAKQAREWLDVEGGLDAARKAGINYIIWSSLGATRDNAPRLSTFFDELKGQQPVMVFNPRGSKPEEGEFNFYPPKNIQTLGEYDPIGFYSPALRIYALNPVPANANR